MLDSVRYCGGHPSALLARLEDLNIRAGFPLSAEVLRHRHASLLPQPFRLQQATAPLTISTPEYAVLADRIHDVHISPNQPSATLAYLCGVHATPHLEPQRFSNPPFHVVQLGSNGGC